MIRLPFCLCPVLCPRGYLRGPMISLPFLIIRVQRHRSMLSTGLIPPVSFSALPTCFMATPLLFRDSTRFSLSDTASKSALTHSHPRSSLLPLHRGQCYSRLIVLLFRLHPRRCHRLTRRHFCRKLVSCLRTSFQCPPRPLLHLSWGCQIPQSLLVAPLTSPRLMTTNVRV
jgi:hypothetical protein